MRTLPFILLLAALPVAVPTSAHAAETCLGKPVTITDLDGGDVLGTDGDDVVRVGPDVTVDAGAGHDTVCVEGTDDADYADVRDAEDLDIRLGAGYDTLHVIRGGAGVGVIDGGADSANVMLIPDRSVSVDLAAGEMSMDGDSAYELAGFDTVLASAKRVRLQGGSGPDHLRALMQSCHIAIEGGRGRDWLAVAPNTVDAPPISCSHRTAPNLFGQGGNDLMVGYRGNDRLYGGAGRDTAKGGFGRDLCRAEVKQACEG
jgi:Ca2+-binding RTX toxin-like protein